MIVVRSRGIDGCDRRRDAGCVAMATTLTVVFIGLRGLGIGWYVKVTDLMHDGIGVRVTLTRKISSAIHTHEEHGNHNGYAPKRSHRAAMLPRFSLERWHLVHIHRG